MKPFVPHLLWAGLAVGAFVFGRSTMPDSSQTTGAGSATTQTLLTSKGSAETAGDASSSSARSEATIQEVRGFIDQFRIGGSGGLNAQGMADAVQAAIKETDRVKSSLMFAMLMDELTPENAEAARESVVGSVSGFESFRYLGLLNYRWGELDGESAVASASSGGGREAGFGTSIALSGWAASDPDAALAWINSKEDLDDRQKNWFTRGAISGMAASDPDGATELVEQLAANNEDGVGRYVEAIAREKIKEGGPAAEAWMESLTSPELRSEALETILDHTRRTSTDDAIALASRYADEPSASGAISEFARELADNGSGQEAIDFASSLPSGTVRTETIKDVYGELARENPDLGATALSGLQGSELAVATASYASRLRDSAQGFEMAATIADPELQQRTLISTGGEWLRDNPEEAAAVIALQPVELQDAIVQASESRDDGRGRDRGRRGRF